MVATLAVPFADYWHWQLLTLINLVVAPALAILGIGCFSAATGDTGLITGFGFGIGAALINQQR